MVDDFPLLARIRPRRFKAGLPFWHQHPYTQNATTGAWEYPPDAFYEGCRYRFSGLFAAPPRAMWYAGSTASCAISETVLRDVFGDEDGFGTVLPAKIAGRRVTALRSTRELRMLDLTAAGLRGCADSEAVRDAWQALTITPVHEDTHAPTAKLLAAAGIEIDGFFWHSRQSANLHGAPLACALFRPPVESGVFVEDRSQKPIDLESAAGHVLLAQALANAGLKLRWQLSEKNENDLAN
jgi:hypothetical protein